MSINLDAIQAQQESADKASVTIEGDALTRDYVRELESVAEDAAALLAYARDLEARIGRVREMHQQHVEFMECVNCCGDWPCPTSTALSEATGGAR